MGKLPAFQFYPADWRKDPGVQTLDYFDRGVWFEMLCLMHESDRRGYLWLNGRAMTDEETAKLLSLEVAKFKQSREQILSKGVASVEQDSGAIFCRRMANDEHLRMVRASAGSAGGRKSSSKRQAKTKQIRTPSSSSSVSSSSPIPKDTPPTPPMDSGLVMKRHRAETELGLGIYPKDFEPIWEAYPNKSSKKFAAVAWIETMGIRPANDLILAKIEEMKKKSFKWQDGKILNLEKWLQAHGWEDQPEMAVEPQRWV